MFRDRFNDLFYKTRAQFYAEPAKIPHGVFAQAALRSRVVSRRASSMAAPGYAESLEIFPKEPGVSPPAETPRFYEVPSPPSPGRKGETVRKEEAKGATTEPRVVVAPYAEIRQRPTLPAKVPLKPPPVVPKERPPPEKIPPRLQLDLQLPALHPDQVMEQLRAAEGVPGYTFGTRWAGRPPLQAELSGFLSCPHCGHTLDPAVLEEQWRMAQGPYADRAQLFLATPPSRTYLPLYGPFFYSGMWETGRVMGQIPPSFFASPYNLHIWTFSKTAGGTF